LQRILEEQRRVLTNANAIVKSLGKDPDSFSKHAIKRSKPNFNKVSDGIFPEETNYCCFFR